MALTETTVGIGTDAHDDLTDQELAATLSHIRTAWGNRASEVSAAQVHALRSRTATAALR